MLSNDLEAESNLPTLFDPSIVTPVVNPTALLDLCLIAEQHCLARLYVARVVKPY